MKKIYKLLGVSIIAIIAILSSTLITADAQTTPYTIRVSDPSADTTLATSTTIYLHALLSAGSSSLQFNESRFYYQNLDSTDVPHAIPGGVVVGVNGCCWELQGYWQIPANLPAGNYGISVTTNFTEQVWPGGNIFNRTITSPLLNVYVGSRPPQLAPYIWTTQTGAGQHSWSAITSSSDGTRLAAADGANGHIYTSSNSGSTWTKRINAGQHFWGAITSSADGNKLAAVDNDAGYIYTSVDGGNTWVERTNAGKHVWGSIVSSADGNKIIAVHYGSSVIDPTIYVSNDGGATWQTYTGGQNWSVIGASVDGKRLAATTGTYIQTSSDGGLSWVERIGSGNRSWSSIASSADGMKLAATVYLGKIYTSVDGGITWVERVGSGNREWRSIASSADGMNLAAVSHGNGYVYTSTDAGVTWRAETVVGQKNWRSVAFSVDGARLAAVDDGGYIYTAQKPLSKPVITSVVPNSGSAGTQVTLTGSFVGVNALQLTPAPTGGYHNMPVNSPDGTHIAFTIPSVYGSPYSQYNGIVAITVSNTAGQISNQSSFNIVPASVPITNVTIDRTVIIASSSPNYLTTRWNSALPTQLVDISLLNAASMNPVSSFVFNNFTPANGQQLHVMSFLLGSIPDGSYLVQVCGAGNMNNCSRSANFQFSSINSSVTVTNPTSGEKLIKGQTYAIRWKSTNLETVNINLFGPNSSRNTIAAGVSAASGEYSWILPTSLADGTYTIAIGKNNIGDESDAFTISTPPLRMLSPNGGETVNIKKEIKISFVPLPGFRHYFNLFNADTGATFNLDSLLGGNGIVGQSTDKQEFAITLPPVYQTIIGEGLRFKAEVCLADVEGSDGFQLCDKSDNFFTLTSKDTSGTIFVTPRIDGRVLTSSEANGCVSSLINPNGQGNTAGCVRSFANQAPGKYSVVWYGGYPAGADTNKKPVVTPAQNLANSDITFYIDFASKPTTNYIINIRARINGRVLLPNENGACAASLVTPNNTRNTAGCIRTLENQPTGTYPAVIWNSGYPIGADTTKKPTISPSYPQSLGDRPAGVNPITFYIDFVQAPPNNSSNSYTMMSPSEISDDGGFMASVINSIGGFFSRLYGFGETK